MVERVRSPATKDVTKKMYVDNQEITEDNIGTESAIKYNILKPLARGSRKNKIRFITDIKLLKRLQCFTSRMLDARFLFPATS